MTIRIIFGLSLTPGVGAPGIAGVICGLIVVVYLIARHGEFAESARIVTTAQVARQSPPPEQNPGTEIRIRCQNCAHMNREGARFCEKCGDEL